MPEYTLSKAADQDLSDIYIYTYREFGEIQADAYLSSIEEFLSKLARNPDLGVDVSGVREGYRRSAHRRHTIYYTSNKKGICVVRVLGPGMAADRHVPPAE